jgi:hypothetical protein
MYKVGDEVIITKSANNWASDMDEYVGKKVIISKIRKSLFTQGILIEFEDSGKWDWSSNCNHFKHADPNHSRNENIRKFKELTL